MPTYLVVANQTLASDELLAHVRSLMEAGPAEFHLVVPATPPKEHLTWTEGNARAIAAAQLERALARMTAEGATVSGEVGDANPTLAVEDVLLRHGVDEIIVSTLPEGASRWLKRGVPDKIRKHHDIPVTHIVGNPEPEY